MSIGANIRQIRQDKNIKQENLANHLKIAQGTLSKIENDSLEISVNDLIKICTYIDTPISRLLPNWDQINAKTNCDILSEDFTLKRIKDLEEWVNDLKIRNLELQEKVRRRDEKIERLKIELANHI